MAKEKLNPNEIKTRDLLLKALICGATKAGVLPDQRKERSKKACRGRVKEE